MINRSSLAILVIIVALVGYALPYTSSSPAGLTLNAYDLAEWTSLHPAVRASSPPLLITALLRLPLLCIIALIAWNTPLRGIGRAILLTIALLISIGMLPPLEILTDPANANYRQQLLWASIGFAFTLASLFRIGVRFYPLMSTAIGIVAIGCSIIGAFQAVELMRGFAINSNIGAGLWVFVISMGGYVFVRLLQLNFVRGKTVKHSIQTQTR